MERHKRKARLVWALAQAAQQNFRHSLASTHRHTRHVLTAAVYINTHQHTLHFFAHMHARSKQGPLGTLSRRAGVFSCEEPTMVRRITHNMCCCKLRSDAH